jgi:hypothetical protein
VMPVERRQRIVLRALVQEPRFPQPCRPGCARREPESRHAAAA